MADCSPVLLWMAGEDGMCSFFNQTWLTFTGRPLAEEVGVGWSEGVHPEDLEYCLTTYMDAFRARISFEMEYRLRRHDGAFRWILDRGAPRYDAAANFVGYIGSCVDITDRKVAESRANENAERLEVANQRMERMLYAASHDLQEPLRMVTNYTQMVTARYRDKLDDKGRRYLGFAEEGAIRMKGLVDGILTLSRVRREWAGVAGLVDLNTVFEDVLLSYKLRIAELGAEIDIPEGMPQVPGCREHLSRMFGNIVGNALKFHREHPPRVRVRCAAIEGHWIISLVDNGLGIDPQFHQEVFQMFRRLHPPNEYAGSGMGLAIVREIAELHDGSVTLQSEPGKGTTVTVQLPASRPSSARDCD